MAAKLIFLIPKGELCNHEYTNFIEFIWNNRKLFYNWNFFRFNWLDIFIFVFIAVRTVCACSADAILRFGKRHEFRRDY